MPQVARAGRPGSCCRRGSGVAVLHQHRLPHAEPGCGPVQRPRGFPPVIPSAASRCGCLAGLGNLTVIKGGGGEFERQLSKEVAAFGLRSGATWEGRYPAILGETRRLSAGTGRNWTEQTPSAFETEFIPGTAALVRDTPGTCRGAEKAA